MQFNQVEEITWHATYPSLDMVSDDLARHVAGLLIKHSAGKVENYHTDLIHDYYSFKNWIKLTAEGFGTTRITCSLTQRAFWVVRPCGTHLIWVKPLDSMEDELRRMPALRSYVEVGAYYELVITLFKSEFNDYKIQASLNAPVKVEVGR